MSKLKTYILSVFEAKTNISDFLIAIERTPKIRNWMAISPNTLFIVSELDAHEITVLIEDDFEDSIFLITEYHVDEANGLLTDDMWDFLNNPQAAKGRVRTIRPKG